MNDGEFTLGKCMKCNVQGQTRRLRQIDRHRDLLVRAPCACLDDQDRTGSASHYLVDRCAADDAGQRHIMRKPHDDEVGLHGLGFIDDDFVGVAAPYRDRHAKAFVDAAVLHLVFQIALRFLDVSLDVTFGEGAGFNRMKEAKRCVVLLCQYYGAIEGAVGIGREIRGDKDSVEAILASYQISEALGSGIAGPSAKVRDVWDESE